MATNSHFLSTVARLLAQPSPVAPSGVSGSMLTVAAGSYGFRSCDDATMPTGFDPHAAALFESMVEAAYLVATADGVFDDDEREAFRTVVLTACLGAVGREQLDALLADLDDMLEEDGLDKRIAMVGQSIRRPDHQREVIRIAAFLAHVSGGVSDVERAVITKLTDCFGLGAGTVDAVLAEVQTAVDAARPRVT